MCSRVVDGRYSNALEQPRFVGRRVGQQRQRLVGMGGDDDPIGVVQLVGLVPDLDAVGVPGDRPDRRRGVHRGEVLRRPFDVVPGPADDGPPLRRAGDGQHAVIVQEGEQVAGRVAAGAVEPAGPDRRDQRQHEVIGEVVGEPAGRQELLQGQVVVGARPAPPGRAGGSTSPARASPGISAGRPTSAGRTARRSPSSRRTPARSRGSGRSSTSRNPGWRRRARRTAAAGSGRCGRCAPGKPSPGRRPDRSSWRRRGCGRARRAGRRPRTAGRRTGVAAGARRSDRPPRCPRRRRSGAGCSVSSVVLLLVPQPTGSVFGLAGWRQCAFGNRHSDCRWLRLAAARVRIGPDAFGVVITTVPRSTSDHAWAW